MALRTTTTRFTSGRSSQRLSVAIGVCVSGKDAQGRSFTEETRTSEVNRTGARVCLARELAAESQMQVTLVSGTRSAAARVVWSRAAEAPGYWDAGLELQEVVDFWGIQFPTDGEWKPTKVERPEETAAPAPRAAEPPAEAQAVAPPEPAPELPPVELDPVVTPARKPKTATSVGQADITDLLNAALTDALQEQIRTGLALLSAEAERKIEEVKHRALDAAETHLRGTIASCGEDLEMRAIELVGRNEQSLEQAAGGVVRRANEQIEARVQDASTRAAEAIQQMLDMANIGCTRLKEDTEQAVSAAANSIRQKLSKEVPQIEDQLVEQCQVRTARLLNSRLEEAETSINSRVSFLARELSARTEEIMARFELELERHYEKLLNAHSEKLEKQLAKAAERLEDEFTRRTARELERRGEELFKELEARTNAAFTQNLNRSRRVFSRSVRELGEALQQEADGFGSTADPA